MCETASGVKHGLRQCLPVVNSHEHQRLPVVLARDHHGHVACPCARRLRLCEPRLHRAQAFATLALDAKVRHGDVIPAVACLPDVALCAHAMRDVALERRAFDALTAAH
jgi:hypothetical protein